MRVLLFTTAKEDYLQDMVIHGLKSYLQRNAIDYPVKDILYSDTTNKCEIRGNGFTLYGLIDPSLKSESLDISEESFQNYDKIIFTSICRQYNLFYKIYPKLKDRRNDIWVLDGEDSEMLFPYRVRHFKELNLLFAIRPHQNVKYFKRELTPTTIKSYFYSLLPISLAKKLDFHKNILPISFSIPAEKIVSYLPDKTKLFAAHIVDQDVAKILNNGRTSYSFVDEAEYYKDIQQSKFGITTKRGGWECLRHYELAANGTVLCFRDLNKKPASCAPHGLIDGYNCISYESYDDLMRKIDIPEDEYWRLLTNSLAWIRQNTTLECVKKMFDLV